MELSASQEDYLETILELVLASGSARVRDIADRLGVAKPSVTLALQGLSKRELVDYEPYQLVTLTEQGEAMAESVRRKHRALSRFLQDVLDVAEPIAEASACRIEHAVPEGLVRRLSCFSEFMSKSEVPSREIPGAFREYCSRQRQSGACEGCRVDDGRKSDKKGGAEVETTLVDIAPGQKVRVVRTEGTAVANRRLVEMGLTPGANVTVKRVAPLGDPVEINVRGYDLSLRKAEAKGVVVKPVDGLDSSAERRADAGERRKG